MTCTILDPVAVKIFAAKGIELGVCSKSDFVWTFPPYLKSEPVSKDLEICIRKDNYMGPIVHRVTVPDVHHDNSNRVADAVLAEYLSTLQPTPVAFSEE